jgi:hypothetical protein
VGHLADSHSSSKHIRCLESAPQTKYSVSILVQSVRRFACSRPGKCLACCARFFFARARGFVPAGPTPPDHPRCRVHGENLVETRLVANYLRLRDPTDQAAALLGHNATGALHQRVQQSPSAVAANCRVFLMPQYETQRVVSKLLCIF